MCELTEKQKQLILESSDEDTQPQPEVIALDDSSDSDIDWQAATKSPFDLKSSLINTTPPSHHEFNYENLKTFLYPVNMQIRDYQRNIIRKSLCRNLICALPTGLGKTFIASVVMLNFFKWTKTAKLVFIAPTRPLVAQQVQSFLEISGISVSETAVLLQAVVDRKDRCLEWQNKRVFFATAQTIENDISQGIVDPKTFVLLVFDEAHKATGNHSYVNVMRMVRNCNQSFRVLALTATPSGNLEGVQSVISNLDIAATEIRSEESLDIRKYVHSRDITKLTFDYTDDQLKLMDLLNESFHEFSQVLMEIKVLHSYDLSKRHFFAVQSETNQYLSKMRGIISDGRKFQIRAVSGLVGKACYAMNMLKTHGVVPFYKRLHQMELELIGSQGKNAQMLRNHPQFKELVHTCRNLIYKQDLGCTYNYTNEDRRTDLWGHKKLEKLSAEVSDFIMSRGADSRIIIFAEFRDSAAEIQWVLQTYNGDFIRSSLFVGQATTSHGIKGMNQKKQQEVLTKFKDGEFNVLIATSIGEEGLDIGQVDLIICYDQSQSPIRNIQRMGRTGRKRDGKVVMLMTEAESNKLLYAFEGHKYIRNKIYDSSEKKNEMDPLNLKYAVPNRVFPNDIEPVYKEVFIETPPENEAALAQGDILRAMKPSYKRKDTAKKEPVKKKQKGDTSLETLGFKPASDLKDQEVQFIDLS